MGLVAIASQIEVSLLGMSLRPRLIFIAPMVCMAWTAFAPVAAASQTVEQDGRLRVLFLGDRGHHQPEARLHQVYGELGRARIAIDYA
jgi:hypothetical protein